MSHAENLMNISQFDDQSFLSGNSSDYNMSEFQDPQNTSLGLQDGGSSSSSGLLVAFHSLVALVILFGNVLVLITIAKRKDLQIPSNLYVFNLAITDILVAVANILRVIELISPQAFNGVFLCTVVRMGTVVFSMMQSIFLMTGIAIDRCLAIFDPYKYQEAVTLTRTSIIISAMWVYSFSISYLPSMLGFHNWVPHADCFLANIIMKPVILNQIVNFFVSTLIIYIIYAALFRIASRHMRDIVSLEIGIRSQATAKIQMHLRAAKTLLFVTGTFSLCWLPFVFNLLTILSTDPNNSNSIPRQVQKFLTILLFVNSGVNPIIYAGKLPGFRSEFIRILTCYRNNVIGNQSVLPTNGVSMHAVSKK